MAQQEVAAGIGLREVYVALRDTTYGVYSVPGTVSKTNVYSGLKVHKSRAMTLTPSTAQRFYAAGDDAVFATFQESPAEMPTGELRVAALDTSVVALLTSTKEFGSPDNHKAIPIFTEKVGAEPQIMLWGVRKASDAETAGAGFGNQMWQLYFVLSAFATPRPSPMEIFTIAEHNYDLACNKSSKDPFGRTFTEALHGCTEAAFTVHNTRYRPMYEVFVGNGAATTFTLSKGSQVKYNTATSPVVCCVNGTLTSVSVNSSGVMTIAPAPADEARIAVMYEWE